MGGIEGMSWSGNKDGRRFFGKRCLEQKGAMALAVLEKGGERVFFWRFSSVFPLTSVILCDGDDHVDELSYIPKDVVM